MTVHRGDIVLFRAQLTGGTGTKVRPMLVVQNDINNARMANTILAQIVPNVSRPCRG